MVGGDLSIDFANHMLRLDHYSSARDQLTIVLSWMEQTGLITNEQSQRYFLLMDNDPELVRTFLKNVIRLRDTVYNIFWALTQGKSPRQKDLGTLNGYIKDCFGHLMIAGTANGFEWKWMQARTIDDYLRPIVRSAAELLTSDRLSRVRLCPGENCGWLFIDRSKNRSRKWCDMKDCGNVVKARNYRKRKGSQ
jgi:predicted RNA-binding Zn ribbon-like protein